MLHKFENKIHPQQMIDQLQQNELHLNQVVSHVKKVSVWPLLLMLNKYQHEGWRGEGGWHLIFSVYILGLHTRNIVAL